MNTIKFNSWLPKAIEYFLYLLIFLLPLQTRWIIKYEKLSGENWEYGIISLYLVDILLIVLITLLISDYFLNKKALNLNKNKKIIIVWLMAGLLELAIISSIFIAPNKLVAIFGYFKFLLGISLFGLIIYANYNFTKLIYAFLAGVFAQASLGIWQFLMQSSFQNKWLGMSLHNPAQPGTSVIGTLGQIMPETFALQGERWLRAYGGLDHPNVLGGLLVIAILLLIHFFIKNPKLKTQKLFIFYFLLFIFLTALFFTFSRAAWLGLCASILILFLIIVYQKDEKIFKRLFEISAVSALLIIILFSQFSNLVLTRIESNTRLEIKSNQERLASYAQSFEIIKNNWFWGAGIGNYTLADKNIDKNAGIQNPSWHYQPVHNTFLLIFAEIGIIGLLAFIGLIILIAKNIKISSTPVIFAILIIMMVDHWLWSLHFGTLLFWSVMGIIVKHHSMNNKII